MLARETNHALCTFQKLIITKEKLAHAAKNHRN